MNTRLLLALLTGTLLVAGCGGGSNEGRAVPTTPATNDDGSPVTRVPTAVFDPGNGNLPFPTNLLLSGTKDLTLNVPVDNPFDFSDPAAALGTLDGFSTTEKWLVSFVDEARGRAPAAIDADSVVPGGSVRFFKVVIDPATTAVIGLEDELTPGAEFVATASGSSVIIIPTAPLEQLSAYMAVLTSDIKDTEGNNVVWDTTYGIAKRTTPLVDANGNSTDPLLDNATAQALEPLRRLTNAQEAVAADAGIDPADIVLSFSASTQSITVVQQLLRSVAQPAPTTVAPAGINTGDLPFGQGAADIYFGIITLPYYLSAPNVENPTAPLTEFWRANPGAYVPPFNGFGLDPTSDFVTAANPFPRKTSDQTVPLLITVPRGVSKPDSGWPVVIFGHGLTRQRTDMLVSADAFASVGYVSIAFDAPLHGVSPDDRPEWAPFYIENTPFGAVANERTFDLDLVNNATGAPGPDGLIDPSGEHFWNLRSLLTTRDNARQAYIDASVLALSVPNIDLDGDGVPDLDASNIAYAAQSGGSVLGTVIAGVEPLIRRFFFSMNTGGVHRTLEASPTFGGAIQAGLAAAGLERGSADYERFFIIAQTIFDPADPINWGKRTAANNAILQHTVVDDQVLPAFIPGAPLAGTEPLMAVMGLTQYNMTTTDPAGLRHRAIFLPPAAHGSLFDPTLAPAATVEMQRQMASFIASFGQQVVVTDPSLMASP